MILLAALAGVRAAGDSRLDSLELALPRLEQAVMSTLMFGGSSPVSFSGEARLKMALHNLAVVPDWMRADRYALQSGWEGNESLIRLGMVARPGRNTVLWSRIGFQHTLPGNRYIDERDPYGLRSAQTRHDKGLNTATIHEDMCAGIAVRTVPASFWLKMGTVLWLEASPLTIWKSQPRTFAWEYLPFEVEQPTARYYEYAIARGAKSGRAAWNRKPFQGIGFESINLPADLYFNLFYGKVPRYDSFEREYLDMSNDLAYAGEPFPIKSSGVGDPYRTFFHARVARHRLLGDLTLGVNALRLNWNDDVVFMEDANGNIFHKTFEISPAITTTNVYEYTASGTDSVLVSPGAGFYKSPSVLSFDARGTTGNHWSLGFDAALSRLDTTWLIADTALHITRTRLAPGSLRPAVVAGLGNRYPFTWELDAAIIAPGFYSPFSFAMPADVFFPFGANLLGAGKFYASSEASPYTQNMAGLQLSAKPQIPGYGHLTIKYGQHLQLRPGQDLIAFPYRLNGMDMFSMFHSSYNRWGVGLVDHSLADRDTRREPWWRTPQAAYQKRMGDESYRSKGYNNPMGPEAGGLWSDNLSMYETFVPYKDSLQALGNLTATTSIYDRSASLVVNNGDGLPADTLVSATGFVPHNRKFTFNLELDAAWDIGPLLGYRNDFFLGGYAALNGVSTSFKPLAFSEKSATMQLWSLYLRFEPAIALTPDFYLLALAGYENWRAANTWMAVGSEQDNRIPDVRAVALDYRDVALGIGFDCTLHERTGLHGRFKWYRHRDVHFANNTFNALTGSLEIKLWF